VRITPAEYEGLDLRAHSLLSDVPLHDVWAVDLPGGGASRTIIDFRAAVSVDHLAAESGAVRTLFRLRSILGRLFGWDRKPKQAMRESYLQRLSPAELESSLVAPGTLEGPFEILLVTPREAISEIQNSTVHAFSVFALVEHSSDYRLYWSIYVRPVGRVTAWYMCLIDPFRRLVIYPVILRRIRAAWSRRLSEDVA
jgi:hypothetical protein